jgi:hypothetical protein
MAKQGGYVLFGLLFMLTVVMAFTGLVVRFLPMLGKGCAALERNLFLERAASLFTAAQGQALLLNGSLSDVRADRLGIRLRQRRKGRTFLFLPASGSGFAVTGPGIFTFTAKGGVTPHGKRVTIASPEGRVQSKAFYFEPVRGRLCYEKGAGLP